jgi:diacylglycerol kinase (ATP)
MAAQRSTSPLPPPRPPAAGRERSPLGVDSPAGEALHPDAPFHRALVVANPIAGRGKGAAVGKEMVEALRERGVAAELYLTRSRGDARARLRCLEPDVDLVVSVGGDGTLREVFSGLLDPSIPVGIVPLGTANVLGRDLDLPRDVDRALEVILARKVAPIDVCTVNGHLSFLVTGVGFDACAVKELEARRKGPITKWDYVAAVGRALLSYQAPRLEVEIDGERVEGHFGLVLVSNIIHYGGILRLSADRRLDDGMFEVYLFRHGHRARLVGYALRGVLGLLPGGSCTLRRARRVRIASAVPVPCHVDGDARGETPIEIEVGAQQYRLLVP